MSVADERPADDAHRVLRLTKLLLPALIACVALAVPAPASAAKRCANATTIPDATNLAQIKKATLCLLNVERRARGRVRLRANGQLAKAARRYSATMVRQGFFDHVSPSGSTLGSRIRAGTSYLEGPVSRWSLGENLAWGSRELATPKQIVRSWMRSPGHKRNILDRRFRHVGIGVVLGAPEDVGGQPAATYTTNFGLRVRR